MNPEIRLLLLLLNIDVVLYGNINLTRDYNIDTGYNIQ